MDPASRSVCFKPSRIRIRIRLEKPWFLMFLTSLWLFTGVPDPYVFGPPGSVRQRHGSEDPDSHPDPYQNAKEPQHWKKVFIFNYLFTGTSLTKKSMVEILSLMKYGNLIMPWVTPQIFVNIGDYWQRTLCWCIRSFGFILFTPIYHNYKWSIKFITVKSECQNKQRRKPITFSIFRWLVALQSPDLNQTSASSDTDDDEINDDIVIPLPSPWGFPPQWPERGCQRPSWGSSCSHHCLFVLNTEKRRSEIIIRAISERRKTCVPGSRILIFTHPRSKNSNKREGWKKVSCHTFFVAINFTKLKIILFLKCWRKKFGPIFKELYFFYYIL